MRIFSWTGLSSRDLDLVVSILQDHHQPSAYFQLHRLVPFEPSSSQSQQ